VNETFEDQLRADLHAATRHTAYPSIDPADVIGEGRRVVRRRHRLQALGAAAAVAAIAVGGVLATDTGRTTTAPPAAPSTSAPPLNRAVLNLTDDGSARFLAELDRDRTTVRVIDASGSSRPVVATLRAPGTGERFDVTTAAAPGTGTIVGLLPTGGHLLRAETDAPSREGGYRSDAQSLGPDLTVFGVRFDDASRASGTPRILWAIGQGGVWDGSRSLPSALFDPPDGSSVPQLVWVDDANRAWGTSDPVGGGLSEKPLEPWSVNSMGSFEPAGSANAGRGTFVVTGLLPDADVSKLTGTWAPGVTVHTPIRAQRLATAPGRPVPTTASLTAFHAVVTTQGELPEPLLQSVSFTGADGKARSHTYGTGTKG
jgi:hypothetical protein